MKEQKYIVVTGIQAWDIEIGSNCKNIASEMSKTDRVLYVNPPLDLISYWKGSSDPKVVKRMKIIKGKTSSLEQINENLWVLTPRFLSVSANWLPGFLFKKVNGYNSNKLAACINTALKELSFGKPYLFCDSDMFRSFHLKEKVANKGFIYYSRDNLMTVPYWKKHGQYFEPAIMRKATVVTTNSPYLQQIASVSNTGSFYVGQGCETEAYLNSGGERPKLLEGIHGTIIGYTGLLSTRRLSISALRHLAKERPNYQIVLVGPQESCFENSDLHKFENVHFLGSVKPEELPAYVHAFDVCINPQVFNDLTKGNYPRKIDEYLAAGKATVATYTPTMEVFKEHCYLANSDQEYPELVDQAINGDSTDQKNARVEFATQHTWANSVEQIWKSFNSVKV